MLKEVALYHFSPTGGTKKVGEMFCKALAKQVNEIDLMKSEIADTEAEVVVFAAPVYGGRIPAVATERMKSTQYKTDLPTGSDIPSSPGSSGSFFIKRQQTVMRVTEIINGRSIIPMNSPLGMLNFVYK